jgi:predicted NUDIX family NTP pyrophosphohydrolase
MFEMEWPPRSGRRQSFPEIDRAAWFTVAEARVKILKGQAAFIDRLLEALGQAKIADYFLRAFSRSRIISSARLSARSPR